MDLFAETLKRTGYLLYIMDPRKHNYEKIEDVRDYYQDVLPLYIVTVVLEQVILYFQKKPFLRVNDAMSSIFNGFLADLSSKIPFKGVEVMVYAWIYTNYRLIDLPWDCPWTWIIGWLATDFSYYWMHRMVHQVNILWAMHETHHSSEEMNLATSFRNHFFFLPIHWITYMPMALAIPPTTYLVHYQISIIYQYWIHSEIIDKLPAPFEFVLNTPSHHRAHHGRNRRYIDKNFGSFLIIWDRIFGTFEAEDPEEKPLFGCTTQMKSFNPLLIQTRHFIHICKKINEYEKWSDKLSVVFKGPGWSPGKPWVGNIEDVPHPAPHFDKYDPQMPLLYKLYTILHFLFILTSYTMLAINISLISKMTMGTVAAFVCFSSISIGFMLDNSQYGPPTEFVRCIFYFLLDKIVFQEIKKFGFAVILVVYANRLLMTSSLVLWISLYLIENLRKIYKEKHL